MLDPHLIAHHAEPLTRLLGLSLTQLVTLVDFFESRTGLPVNQIGSVAMPTKEGIADPDYKSADTPAGYDTVVGYITEHLPHLWDIMDHTAEATQRDGYWLTHRARERGLHVVRVSASPWLVRQGIFEVNAYPLALLAERFGE